MKQINYITLLISTMLFSVGTSVAQKNIAFPSAEGCGKYASGGRGGEIIWVTNLNNDGEGSLRDAVENQEGPRTILFAVSGNIEIKEPIRLEKGDVTIAGQSAPGDGICVMGSGFIVNAENVIIRYMRFRPGDINFKETDALTVVRSKNVIIDHCSTSWSIDETCSCYDNENFTLQYCIISESLNDSYHHKGKHGYGGIWGGMDATYHHNLIMHHMSRNPRLHGSRYHKQPDKERAEFVNNVVYNWGMKCIYAGENGNYNLIGNYFKPGPATSEKISGRILEPWEPMSNYYFEDNLVHKNKELTKDNHKAILLNSGVTMPYWLEQPHKISDYEVVDAETAYKEVLAEAGASLVRDDIDARLVKEVKKGKTKFGNGIINSQEQIGDWPELKTSKAPKDTDHDGMPDKWEKKHDLNPQNAANQKEYNLQDGYTNLEVYLNSIVE